MRESDGVILRQFEARDLDALREAVERCCDVLLLQEELAAARQGRDQPLRADAAELSEDGFRAFECGERVAKVSTSGESEHATEQQAGVAVVTSVAVSLQEVEGAVHVAERPTRILGLEVDLRVVSGSPRGFWCAWHR